MPRVSPPVSLSPARAPMGGADTPPFRPACRRSSCLLSSTRNPAAADEGPRHPVGRSGRRPARPRSPLGLRRVFWLGVLGPTATWLLRRLVAGFDRQPNGYELDVAGTARRARLERQQRAGESVRQGGQALRHVRRRPRHSDGWAVRRRLPRLQRHLVASPTSCRPPTPTGPGRRRSRHPGAGPRPSRWR